MIDDTVFKNPPARFRAKPFWALNGELKREHLKFQIECMKKMGFGGAFLHARTGLVTEYMSDEWLSLLGYAADVLRENGMEAYLYDEDRWPSGTCGGLVTETKEFRAKSMVYDVVERGSYTEPENFLALFAVTLEDGAVKTYRRIRDVSEGGEGETLLCFSYLYMLPDTFYNGYTYVDTMNRAATERFLELTHERYRAVLGEKFGKEIIGIFTDEPHRGSLLNGFSRKEDKRLIEIPYTYCLFDEFAKRRGYRIEDHLPVLWFGKAGEPFCKEMYDLIEVEEELFLENYAIPYRDWCKKYRLVVTGHVLHEDNLAAQTTMCGSVMRYYEYMDFPGMDNLTEENFSYNVPKLVSSVARQLGKEAVLDELYAATGWKMRLADYKRTGDWQSAGGVTLRCPHLSWYTMKGEAKRDYPASILHQSGWYRDYHLLEDYFARMHYLLSEGESMTDTAIVNPIESTWGLTNQYAYHDAFLANAELYRKIEGEYYGLYRDLLIHGFETDYLDEGVFAEHGRVEGGKLFCGRAGYRRIILNGNLNLRSTTLAALKALLAQGGTVIVAGDLPRYLDGVPHDFTSELKGAVVCGFAPEKVRALLAEGETVCCDLIAVRRRTEEGMLVFLLNPPENGAVEAEIAIRTDKGCCKLDLRTGEREPVAYTRRGDRIVIKRQFARDEELMLLVGEELPAGKESAMKPVVLPETFSYTLNEPNFLVLDNAEYAIDGEPQGSGYVLRIDEAVRDRFGLERRNNEMIQPWFRKKFGGTDKKYCRVTLTYAFDAETIPGEIFLMTEDAEKTDVVLNGAPVEKGEILPTPIDNCFGLIRLPGNRLRKGRNTLTLGTDFYAESNLEGSFLCGAFGVRAGDPDTIVALPEKLAAGDLCLQGLPYYGGTVTLSCPLAAGEYLAETEDLGCAVMKVNGSPIAFPPFRAAFRSVGELDVALVMTRNNLFGCSDDTGKHTLRPQGLMKLLKVLHKN